MKSARPPSRAPRPPSHPGARKPTERSRAHVRTPVRAPASASATTTTARGLQLPPEAVEAFAMGLALYDRGYGGAGLVPATIREARDAERTGRVSEDKARRMAAWFARHGASPAENAARRRDRSSPASVAWLLWGGDAGRAWADQRRNQQSNQRNNRQNNRGSDPRQGHASPRGDRR